MKNLAIGIFIFICGIGLGYKADFGKSPENIIPAWYKEKIQSYVPYEWSKCKVKLASLKPKFQE